MAKKITLPKHPNETYNIAEGNIDARDFENNVEALRFSLEEGY